MPDPNVSGDRRELRRIVPPLSVRITCLTTVAPGTTEFVAWPILKRAFAARGIQTERLLAHSFERVMPGRD